MGVDRRRFLRDAAVVGAGAGATTALSPRTASAQEADYVRKGELVVNVKDHGAVGDGTTNDSVALESAQAVGRSLFFPAGTYVVNAGVLRPPSGSNWFGEGDARSRIKLADGESGDVVTVDGTSAVRLRDLAVDGNRGAAFSAAGIAVRDSSRVTIERVEVANASECSIRYSGRVADFDVSHCRLIEMGVRGIAPQGATPAEVSLDRFSFSSNFVTTSDGTNDSGSAGFAIQAAFARDGVINGNFLDGGTTNEFLNGLILRGCRALAVTGNTVRRMYDDGITITEGCRDLSIIGNTLTESQLTCGIFFIDPGGPSSHSRITIVGNNLNDNWLGGIRLAGIQDAVIEGNSCCDNARFGIVHPGRGSESTETSNVVIASNVIAGNGESGMLLAGGTGYLISENVLRGNGVNLGAGGDRSGLQFMDVSDSSVTGNRFIDRGEGATQEHGIALLNSSRNIISENVCQGNQKHGIYLINSGHNLISSNRVEGNSQLAHATYNAIDIAGTGGHNSVQGNQIRRGSGTRHHSYALNISAPATLVRGNDFHEASVAGGVYAINIHAGVPETVIEENRALPATIAVSGDYSISPKERAVLVNASGGTRTITLPRATDARGRQYTIKKVDVSENPVVLTASGSDKIDGATTLVVTLQKTSAGVLSDGSAWRVIY